MLCGSTTTAYRRWWFHLRKKIVIIIITIFFLKCWQTVTLNFTYFTTWKSSLNNLSMISWKSSSRQMLNDLTNAKFWKRTMQWYLIQFIGNWDISRRQKSCLMLWLFSQWQRHTQKKENPSSPNRSQTYDLPITSLDALPLSYRRLVGAKAIKLGSSDKIISCTVTRHRDIQILAVCCLN